MPYHNPNSRSRRNVLRIVGVLVVLAVIAGVANFLHATTSEAAGNVKPQIETMQDIRQTAQDSITFAQSLDDPDQFAAHIETVQQYMDDYDRLADTKQIKYLLSDNLQERIIGLLYRNQQRTIIDSMRVAAHNLDAQTKELLSAVDAAMADDFSQHAAQWLLQVDDPTQVNELIDRYGKQREYSSMREMLTGLESLHKLRSDVKQQVSSAVNNLHSEEASAAAIAVPERNGDLDPAGWYTLATNVVSTMGVQIEQTMEFNCGGQSGENPSGFVAAYYCQMPDRSQRNVVHMLTTHPDWTQTARSPWLVHGQARALAPLDHDLLRHHATDNRSRPHRGGDEFLFGAVFRGRSQPHRRPAAGRRRIRDGCAQRPAGHSHPRWQLRVM